MPENKLELFCQLDPQRECPSDCKLYRKTLEITQADNNRNDFTTPELIERIRRGN